MAVSVAQQHPSLRPCHSGTPLLATCTVTISASTWWPVLATWPLWSVPASPSCCRAEPLVYLRCVASPVGEWWTVAQGRG